MGKSVITIEGHMYLVDDETGAVKEVIVQDRSLTPDVFQKIIKYIFDHKGNAAGG